MHVIQDVLDKEVIVAIELMHVLLYFVQTNLISHKIRRLSYRQLKALHFLCQSSIGLASSSPVGIKMGVVGKPLGGVFSSLSRQKINGQPLVTPFGRGDEGRGLRWKLNTNLISLKDLSGIVNELLDSWREEI